VLSVRPQQCGGGQDSLNCSLDEGRGDIRNETRYTAPET